MSKSSVARLRSGSAFATLGLLGLVSVAAAAHAASHVHAADSEEAARAPAWLERSREILEEASESEAPPWLRAEVRPDALGAAVGLAEDSGEREAPQGNAQPRAGRVFIFASFSIPTTTLRSLLEQATEPDVMLVLRGVAPGADLRNTLERLKALVADRERVPNVLIDPTLYRRYGVEEVPTFVLERGETMKPVTAVGAITLEGFRRLAGTVTPGAEHLGRRAEAYSIAETDLILEMQQRLARIDWTARKQAAVEGFWKSPRVTFVDLPDAREAREFTVDPTVRVTEDIEDAEGHRLVAAGETFNPLDWVHLSKTIVVFRGTDPRQVAMAADAAKAARASGHPVILLTTRIDVERGWLHLSQLEHDLAGTVYVLPELLAERFHLEHVPAMVVSQGRNLRVTELPVKGLP